MVFEGKLSDRLNTIGAKGHLFVDLKCLKFQLWDLWREIFSSIPEIPNRRRSSA